jgi:ABC-type lipoprotein release transport system permease subunit
VNRRRPRTRTGRALLWILLIIAALIVLSVLFGGFQKGTRESGLGALPIAASAVAA